MLFTKAHSLFPDYQRVAAMRPICTLAQIILVRSGRAMHARLERELWDAVQARNNPLIELNLDELEDLERRIRDLPPHLAREIAPPYRSRNRRVEHARDSTAADISGDPHAEECAAANGAPSEDAQVATRTAVDQSIQAI